MDFMSKWMSRSEWQRPIRLDYADGAPAVPAAKAERRRVETIAFVGLGSPEKPSLGPSVGRFQVISGLFRSTTTSEALADGHRPGAVTF